MGDGVLTAVTAARVLGPWPRLGVREVLGTGKGSSAVPWSPHTLAAEGTLSSHVACNVAATFVILSILPTQGGVPVK